jgi:hypothetical protein
MSDLDPQLERRNVLTGLALLALALLLFAGTVGIGLLYLHFD